MTYFIQLIITQQPGHRSRHSHDGAQPLSFFPTVKKKRKKVVAVIAALLKLFTQMTHVRNITIITILLAYLLNGDGIEKRGMRRAQTGLSCRPK